MKLNKILSSLLVFAMLFTTLVSVIPITALADGAGNAITVKTVEGEDKITDADLIKGIAQSYLEYNFATAEEMLNYELEKKYLASIETAVYSLYLNVYTGVVYYKNNLTGQILTSNPIDSSYQTSEIAPQKSTLDKEVMSQIYLEYSALTGNESGKYNSLEWIMNGSLLEVSKIENGLSAAYTLGELSANFIAPGTILAETFNTEIAKPMFDKLASLLEEYCGAFNETTGKKYSVTSYDISKNPNVIRDGAKEYSTSNVSSTARKLRSYAYEVLANNSVAYKEVQDCVTHIENVFSAYTVFDHSVMSIEGAEVLVERIPALADEKNVFYRSDILAEQQNLVNLRLIDRAIRACAPEYTLDDRKADEAECGFVDKATQVPSFRVTINYTLDESGILSYEIPTDENSLNFDRSVYTITSITPLKYFGAGDMNNGGYIFFPDGSGTIFEFEDFYYGDGGKNKVNPNVNVFGNLYGSDYAYAEVKDGAHREQVTMPVYGLVSKTNTGATTSQYTDKSKVDTGFFAIVEDGTSSVNLAFGSGGKAPKYGFAYSSVSPFPADKFDLSQSISVNLSGFYYVVAEVGYEGSYVTRINMLSDVEAAARSGYSAKGTFYAPTYVSMADCYQDYLKAKGDITAFAEVANDLPLYVEALGSIDIVQRILTFPVTVSTPLTTFADVAKMYDEFSNAIKTLEAKRDQYKTDGLDPEDDKLLIENYTKKYNEYQRLVDTVVDIKNVNFRLTGFANGGMYFTYPAKVRWENSVGGDNGFRDLLNAAKTANDKSGYTFGVYPDFDFLFINNTAAFDGITLNRHAARMVDNRYASKQEYDSVTQKYESLFALVLSTDSLDELYGKFYDKYSKFGATGLSVSTLGSTLNSNFDEKNIINRETSLDYVVALLARMTNKDEGNYSLMTDVGNIYSVKYVDHILNAATDSSHFTYSSYSIPFYGMVLHGYVNYAGSPLNYSGSPDYDILRSIESGAALYYILCSDNTNYLKEDEQLSDYYGIDYDNWYDKIVEQYAKLNDAIGKYQKYEIAYHTILKVERELDAEELVSNAKNVVSEYVSFAKVIFDSKIDAFIKATAVSEPNFRGGYQVTVSDTDKALMLAFVEDSFADASEVVALLPETTDAQSDRKAALADSIAALKADFTSQITTLLATYEQKYAQKSGAKNVDLLASDMVYESRYAYETDSVCTDTNYNYTDFTTDNGSVVMVTYALYDQNGNVTDTVSFILNYNVYSVNVTIDNTIDKTLADGETKTVTIEQYRYEKYD